MRKETRRLPAGDVLNYGRRQGVHETREELAGADTHTELLRSLRSLRSLEIWDIVTVSVAERGEGGMPLSNHAV